LNHLGYAHELLVMALKEDVMPSCNACASFHQKLTTLSGPRAHSFSFVDKDQLEIKWKLL